MKNNKNVKGNFHLRFMLRDVFGFAEHQERDTYGLGFKLTLTRKKDEAIIDKVAGIADARIKMIISIGLWLIIHLPLNNKVFCLNRF